MKELNSQKKYASEQGPGEHEDDVRDQGAERGGRACRPRRSDPRKATFLPRRRRGRRTSQKFLDGSCTRWIDDKTDNKILTCCLDHADGQPQEGEEEGGGPNIERGSTRRSCRTGRSSPRSGFKTGNKGARTKEEPSKNNRNELTFMEKGRSLSLGGKYAK